MSTLEEQGQGNFKTPALREVARTAPYMHDGSRATSEDVIEYYNRGGKRNPGLDSELRVLHLSASEKQELISARYAECAERRGGVAECRINSIHIEAEITNQPLYQLS